MALHRIFFCYLFHFKISLRYLYNKCILDTLLSIHFFWYRYLLLQIGNPYDQQCRNLGVQSSVPIQETTSVTTLVLVRLSMDTAKWWGIFSRLCPSTANSLSPHLQGISEQKMHFQISTRRHSSPNMSRGSNNHCSENWCFETWVFEAIDY